jgi:uncharacterized protein YciI
MLFAFICFDKTNSADLRQRIRAEHIEYMMTVLDDTAFGGPLLSDDGETSVGSIFAIEFADRAAAEAFIKAEPYTKLGLFETPRIFPWKQMAPEVEKGSLQRELDRQRGLAGDNNDC